MKLPQSLITMGLISSLLTILGWSRDTANGQALPPSSPRPKIVSLEGQLETFKKLGFILNPGIKASDIDRWSGKKEFETPPYELLYVTLGQTIEREPWTPLTDRVLDFDTEAIEDHGDYVAVMKDLQRISRGELRFEKLKDYVDIEAGKAWVSFSINGASHRWDLKVDDDWADPALFSKVVDLTKKLNTKGRYTYFNTGGQDAVIGYETPEGRNAIISATGLKIDWLN